MALSWLFAGGGLELYNEILATGSRSAGSNGRSTASMTCARCGSAPRASAWEMMKTMGVSVVTLAGGEVIPALERGAIEGAEWAIPSHDIVMGFQNVAKYYYMPDLRQPASYQEVAINKKKWDELPADLKAIVKWACMAEIIRMTAYSVDLDSKAVEELEKKHGVQIRRTPDDILKAQVAAIDKVYEVEAQKNPFFAKVLKSQKEFASRAVPHAQRIRPPIEVVVAHYWKK